MVLCMTDELRCEFCHNIYDLLELRNRTGVFRDREQAGLKLSEMLKDYKETDAVVLAIPAGGVPVAATLAENLNLILDVVVVSKITLPWNTEVGYGAVAFDGTVKLNEDMVAQMELTTEDIEDDIAKASQKVQRRYKNFRGSKPFPDLLKHPAILVDDGVASGFTMLVAVEALKHQGVSQLIVAVPTGHLQALEKVSPEVDHIYCANIRGGWGFAVADAYQTWYDVEEDVVMDILK